MQKARILIIGQEKDSAYALRNVFEIERHEIELALQLDVAKAILRERWIDLVVLDPAVCLEDDFDLLDFELDHGLEVPLVIVGGESTGVRRKIRSRGGIKVHTCPADGFKLLDLIRDLILSGEISLGRLEA